MGNEKKNSSELTTLWNKGFIMVLLLGILTQGSSQMVTTLITSYARDNLGAALTFASVLSATLSISALCCRPFSGVLVDRVNRKNVLLTTSLVTAACMVGYAVVPSSRSLLACRILHGIAFAFQGVANLSFGSMFIPDDKMGEGVGYLSIGAVLAQAVGPSIGISLSRNYSYSMVFMIAAVLSLAGFVLLLLIPYKHVPKPADQRKKFSLETLIEPKVILLAMILMLFSCGNGLMNTYAKLLGEERNIAGIGLFFTAYSISTLACRPFVGKLLDKKGLTVILIPAILLAASAMVLVGAATATWMVVIAGALKAAGQGSATPSIQGTAIKRLGKDRSGVIGSTCYIGQDIGNAFAPIIGSYVVKSSGYSTLFNGYAAILCVCGIGLYMLHLKLAKNWGWN